MQVTLMTRPTSQANFSQLFNIFQNFPLKGLSKDSICPEDAQASSLPIQNVTLENTVTYRISIGVSSFDDVAIIVYDPHCLCNCFGLFYLLYFGSVCLKRCQCKNQYSEVNQISTHWQKQWLKPQHILFIDVTCQF